MLTNERKFNGEDENVKRIKPSVDPHNKTESDIGPKKNATVKPFLRVTFNGEKKKESAIVEAVISLWNEFLNVAYRINSDTARDHLLVLNVRSNSNPNHQSSSSYHLIRIDGIHYKSMNEQERDVRQRFLPWLKQMNEGSDQRARLCWIETRCVIDEEGVYLLCKEKKTDSVAMTTTSFIMSTEETSTLIDVPTSTAAMAVDINPRRKPTGLKEKAQREKLKHLLIQPTDCLADAKRMSSGAYREFQVCSAPITKLNDPFDKIRYMQHFLRHRLNGGDNHPIYPHIRVVRILHSESTGNSLILVSGQNQHYCRIAKPIPRLHKHSTIFFCFNRDTCELSQHCRHPKCSQTCLPIRWIDNPEIRVLFAPQGVVNSDILRPEQKKLAKEIMSCNKELAGKVVNGYTGKKMKLTGDIDFGLAGLLKYRTENKLHQKNKAAQ